MHLLCSLVQDSHTRHAQVGFRSPLHLHKCKNTSAAIWGADLQQSRTSSRFPAAGTHAHVQHAGRKPSLPVVGNRVWLLCLVSSISFVLLLLVAFADFLHLSLLFFSFSLLDKRCYLFCRKLSRSTNPHQTVNPKAPIPNPRIPAPKAQSQTRIPRPKLLPANSKVPQAHGPDPKP